MAKLSKFSVIFVLVVGLSVVFAGERAESKGGSVSILIAEHPTISVLQQDLPNFEKETGIKLNVDILPESGMIQRGMLSLSQGTGEYDVVMCFGSRTPEYSRNGWIMSLDKFIEQERETEFNFGDFLPKVMQIVTVDDSVYGLPFTVETNILYYNKELFAKAGLSGPPTSTQELMDYAKSIKEKTGVAGFAIRGAEGLNVFNWSMIRKLFGVEDWFRDGWEPTFTDPKSIEATTFWANILQNYGPQGIGQFGWKEEKELMQQGRVGMILDTSMWNQDFENPELSAIPGEVGYAHMSGPGDNHSVVSAWVFFIAQQAENPEGAWEFLKWLTSKDLQLAQAKRGGRPNASRLSVWNAPEFQEAYGQEWSEAAVKSLEVADPFHQPLIPEGYEIRARIGIYLSQILTGKIDVEKGMELAKKDAKEILERAGYYKK